MQGYTLVLAFIWGYMLVWATELTMDTLSIYTGIVENTTMLQSFDMDPCLPASIYHLFIIEARFITTEALP